MALDYTLEKETENQLFFKENGSVWWLLAVFCLIGGAMLFFGLFGFATDISNGGIPGKIDFMLTGVGLVFTAGGFLVWTTRFENPKFFIFDNERAVVHIQQKTTKEGGSADIPYSEIEGFTIRARVNTGSNSSGSSNSTTYYIVCWFKKDGSIWSLSEFSSMEKADQLKMKLESWVKLDKSSVNVASPQVSNSVQLVQSGGQVGFRWRNKIDQRVFLFLVAVMGFGCLSGSLYVSEGAEAAFWMLSGFIALVVSLLIYSIVKSLTTTYMLSVTSSELQFLQNEKVSASMPLQEIACISFDFEDEQGESNLLVLNQEQYGFVRSKVKNKELTFSDIGEITKLASGVFRLDMQGLNVVDKVNIEQMLQKIIFKEKRY